MRKYIIKKLQFYVQSMIITTQNLTIMYELNINWNKNSVNIVKE